MSSHELSKFNIKTIKIMVHLLTHNIVNDEIMETLRNLELDYFSLLDKNKILEKRLNIDEKTQLLKYNTSYVENIIKTASRYSASMKTDRLFNIAYLRFDIDDFSFLNNRFGHENGDIVIKKVAHIIAANSRPTDYCIRFGGEEFDIILPSTDCEGALHYAQKVNKQLQKNEFTFEEKKVQITLSGGLADFSIKFGDLKDTILNKSDEVLSDLQSQADNALYDAKNSGKNRCEVYDKNKDYIKIRENYISNSKKTSDKK